MFGKMTPIWPVRWEPERRSLSRGMAICWRWESPLESKSLRCASCWFDYQGRFDGAESVLGERPRSV